MERRDVLRKVVLAVNPLKIATFDPNVQASDKSLIAIARPVTRTKPKEDYDAILKVRRPCCAADPMFCFVHQPTVRGCSCTALAA